MLLVRLVHLRSGRRREALHAVVAPGKQYRAESVDDDMDARAQRPGLAAALFRDDADALPHFEVHGCPGSKGEVGDKNEKRGNRKGEDTSPKASLVPRMS